jgi:tubulin---tyrosine ligase
VGKGFFELFGYDFLVDEDYECWLIEVNTNPCLEESSPLLQTLIPRMVNDMLRLTVDLAFGPIKGQNQYD